MEFAADTTSQGTSVTATVAHKDTFFEKLERRVFNCDSLLCVGVEPKCSLDILLETVSSIIEQTYQHAAAFSFNLAFFIQHGDSGVAILKEAFALIPDDIPIILDLKICDTGNSCQV